MPKRKTQSIHEIKSPLQNVKFLCTCSIPSAGVDSIICFCCSSNPHHMIDEWSKTLTDVLRSFFTLSSSFGFSPTTFFFVAFLRFFPKQRIEWNESETKSMSSSVSQEEPWNWEQSSPFDESVFCNAWWSGGGGRERVLHTPHFNPLEFPFAIKGRKFFMNFHLEFHTEKNSPARRWHSYGRDSCWCSEFGLVPQTPNLYFYQNFSVALSSSFSVFFLLTFFRENYFSKKNHQ